MACTISKMKINNNIQLLLRLINSNADVDALMRRGLRYSQIGALLENAVNEGLITDQEEGYKLTSKGKELMAYDISTKKMRRDGGWISPEDESRIDRIDKFDIYLPDIENSHFK